MNDCLRCKGKYDWKKSTASLKLSYCGILCEIGDLGFSIDAALTMQRGEKLIKENTIKESQIVSEIVKEQDDDRKELVTV